jgi:hypothetical protein
LVLQQPSITGGSAQFPGLRLLLARNLEGSAELGFGALEITAKLKYAPLYPQRFGEETTLLSAGPPDLLQRQRRAQEVATQHLLGASHTAQVVSDPAQ